MSEFKVGDRVKAKEGYQGFDGDRPGAGTIVEIGNCGDLLVRFDDWNEGHSGRKLDGSTDKWWLGASELEPANGPPAARFIVIYHDEREYDTQEKAEEVAASRASSEPGSKFAVLKVVSVACASTAAQFERFA